MMCNGNNLTSNKSSDDDVQVLRRAKSLAVDKFNTIGLSVTGY